MTFGYDANTKLNKEWRHFPEQAVDLMALLSFKRQDCKHRPLIVVCHSQGGLLFKQAFKYAANNHPFSHGLFPLLGVIFLGTPHNGSRSSLVSFSSRMSLVANTYRTMYLQYEDESLRSRGQHLQMSETAILDELEAQPIQALDVQRELLRQKNGQTESQDKLPEDVKTALARLNEYFNYAWRRCEHAWHPPNWKGTSLFRIYNFYETKKVYNMIMVVDQQAADLGIPLGEDYAETKAMVGADHLSICKFDSEQDQGYQEVLQCFKTMTEQLQPDDVRQRRELEKAKASRPDKYIWDTELAEYPNHVKPRRKKAPLLGKDDWKEYQGEGVSNSIE